MEQECVSDFFNEITNEANQSLTPNSSQEFKSSSEDDNSMHLSLLNIEELQPLNIPNLFNLSPRAMPLSPHYVFEEEFSNNPWILLIATIFLSKTSGKVARPHMKKFFEQFPTPYHVLDVNPSVLEMFFETLGLKKRGNMIWRMTYQFVSSKWRRASDLYGIGKYGEDAYRIFCLGHTDLDPGDRYLKLYMDWLRGQTSFLEDHGVQDCESLIEDPVLKYYSVTLREC